MNIQNNDAARRVALVTGVTGQDGAYLAELLLKKNYKVIGGYRRASTLNLWRLKELGITEDSNFSLVDLDITDASSVIRVLESYQPNEVYNLAAQSFVGSSFANPIATANISGLGALNMLEGIRIVDSNIRFYQASTSEMFGLVQEVPQRETTPFYPRSPYGSAKLFAHWSVINYRESYNLHASSGILFNHESPLRGLEFVTRKISDAVVKISRGDLRCLELGNLNAQRDWGYAGDYVEGMWRMVQAESPDTYVLATGRKESIRYFATLAFRHVGIEVEFSGVGVNEVGINTENGETVLRINEKFYRPTEVDLLIGDASLARDVLGWRPEVSLESLCEMMVTADLKR